MRITTSAEYHGNTPCDFLEYCDRQYCKHHRMLWSSCESIQRGYEGDLDVPGGHRAVVEIGDCPKCTAEYKKRKFQRELDKFVDADMEYQRKAI